MTTARDIVTGAARLLGVVRKGVALDDDEATDGLEALNAMLLSWSSSSLNNIAGIRDVFTLTGGTASYTISETGSPTVTAIVPTKIVSAYITEGSIDYPLIEISSEEYEAISMKTISGRPEYFNYTTGEDLEPINGSLDYNGKIRLYPVPTGGTLNTLSEKPILRFATLNESNNLLPTWLRAIKYNLAIDMAPEFGIEPSAAVVKIAKESLGALRLTNAKSMKMRSANVNYSYDYKGPYG